MECIFCQIVAGKIPADIVYQDDSFLAFRDIHPQSPKHVLIVPKAHIASLTKATIGQRELLGNLLLLAKELAEREKVAAKGYRVVINSGSEGGQIVPHLHLHLLGGKKLNDLLG